MRTPIEKTSTITPNMYRLLLDCCKSYYNNIAWKFPLYNSTDTRIYGGINEKALISFLVIEIPTLYAFTEGKHKQKFIASPLTTARKPIEYDQYALLDFIEFIAENIKDVSIKRDKKSYRGHDDELVFSNSSKAFDKFRNEINNIFNKAGLLFVLTEQKTIERVIEYGVLSTKIDNAVQNISEIGIKELLEESFILFKQPNPVAKKDATEKIWDAFERLKTYYTELDKKSSTDKIVNDMSGQQAEFISLFYDEFKALTKIGNDFRIRHHETNKIDITDLNYYDYFFNRCLSLISLAIRYLKQAEVTT